MQYWKKVILSGGKFLNQFGDILQNIAPVIPCDATVTMMQTMGKGSQNEIWRVEGSNPSVSRYLCAIYYEHYQAASPGGTYCKRYLPWFITSTWAKKGGQKRNLRISLKQPVVGRLISIMANQKVNERGVSIWRQKLGSILIYWSCLTEKRSWNPPP